MPVECLLSNGECPITCPLFQIAGVVTEKEGTEYVRLESRTDVEAALVFDDQIHNLQPQFVFNSCELEAANPDSPTRTWE